jgi:hypothetical protein
MNDWIISFHEGTTSSPIEIIYDNFQVLGFVQVEYEVSITPLIQS